ncbi:hypothetical protein [Kamptonema formosum]|uniref:hypothetical protein n=1 Tax=Kamptonema formosum TaxID=331992 RepID=UPI0012D776CE|nr:hypothetical protein [Kamptonema formosum]
MVLIATARAVRGKEGLGATMLRAREEGKKGRRGRRKKGKKRKKGKRGRKSIVWAMSECPNRCSGCYITNVNRRLDFKDNVETAALRK